MKNFTVYITISHRINDIEAADKEEAKRIAEEDCLWDDHIRDVVIDVEENLSDEEVATWVSRNE